MSGLPDQHSDRPSCLILHGLGGGAYELEPLTTALEAAGFRTSSPVLPGHEGPGPWMPASRWADWAATAEAGLDELAAGEGAARWSDSRPGRSWRSAGDLPPRRAAGAARPVLRGPVQRADSPEARELSPTSGAADIPHLPRRPPAVRDREMHRPGLHRPPHSARSACLRPSRTRADRRGRATGRGHLRAEPDHPGPA